MLSHVDEDLLPVCVLCLDYEADLRLNNCATFGIDDWVTILINVLFLICIKVLRHLSLHQLLVHFHELLM